MFGMKKMSPFKFNVITALLGDAIGMIFIEVIGIDRFFPDDKLFNAIFVVSFVLVCAYVGGKIPYAIQEIVKKIHSNLRNDAPVRSGARDPTEMQNRRM